MQSKKRGYFFTLDAALGLSILIIGVFLITSSYVNVRQPTQVELLSDDLLKFFSTTKIKDLNNPYAGIGGQLWSNGTITNGDNSLLQQIGEFYARNNTYTADKFIANVSKNVIPEQFLYEVWIEDALVYPRVPSSQHISSRNSTNVLTTSKIFTFGILDKTTSQLWGPYKVEVFLWER